MFVDEVKIFVAAGAGGNGCNAMRKEKYVPRGGPFGGNGGRGGDIVLRATQDANNLSKFYRQRHFRGGRGGHGGAKDCYGRYGQPLVMEVPLGTVVRDAESSSALCDLLEAGDTFVVARGGRGGRGNTALSRAHHMAHFAEKGEAGEERWVILELKLLADVGIVGVPNAGKSTLLSRVSAAKPKIADYPFTTLTPHLGVVRLDRDSSFVMADIPGLVEGAHDGKGMGDRFLRHIERTRLIVHLVDVSGWEGRDPVKDWRAINRELALWHPFLASKPQLLVANKMDVDTFSANLKRLKRAARGEVFAISAVTGEGVAELLREIMRMLPGLPVPRPPEPTASAGQPLERPLSLDREGEGCFVASGTRLERLVRRTFLENPHAVEDLQNKLYRMGLDEMLVKAGAAAGDLVRIGKFEFFYAPDEQ